MQNSIDLDSALQLIGGELSCSPDATLVVANLFAFDCRSPLSVGDSAFLFPPQESSVEQLSLGVRIHELFEACGLGRLGAIYTRGSRNSLLIVWTAALQSEVSLLRFPLGLLNLCLESHRPIIVGESIVGTRSRQTTAENGTRFRDLGDIVESPLVSVGPPRGDKSFAALLAGSAERWRQAEAVDRSISLALDLLLSADGKWAVADQGRTRLVEYMIALEAILLDQEAELAHRFALRMSVLLNPGPERVAEYETARRLYKLRSTAVHAGARQAEFSDDEADSARTALRLCLLRYMALVASGLRRGAILEMLDKALLSQAKASELAIILQKLLAWPTATTLKLVRPQNP